MSASAALILVRAGSDHFSEAYPIFEVAALWIGGLLMLYMVLWMNRRTKSLNNELEKTSLKRVLFSDHEAHFQHRPRIPLRHIDDSDYLSNYSEQPALDFFENFSQAIFTIDIPISMQ